MVDLERAAALADRPCDRQIPGDTDISREVARKLTAACEECRAGCRRVVRLYSVTVRVGLCAKHTHALGRGDSDAIAVSRHTSDGRTVDARVGTRLNGE